MNLDDSIWKGLKHIIIYLCSGLFVVFVIIAVAVMWLPEKKGQLIISYVDAAGSVIGATLGSILAFVSIVFLVYSLRYQTNEKKRDEQELDKNRLIYFYALLCQSIEFLEAMVKNFTLRNSDFQKNAYAFPMLKVGVFNATEKISHTIDQQEIYLSFRNTFKSDEILKCLETVNAVNTEFKEILIDLEKNYQRFHERLSTLDKVRLSLSVSLSDQRDLIRICHQKQIVTILLNAPQAKTFLTNLENEIINLELVHNRISPSDQSKFEQIRKFLVEPYLASLQVQRRENLYDFKIGDISNIIEACRLFKQTYSAVQLNLGTEQRINAEATVKFTNWLKYLLRFKQQYENLYFLKYSERLTNLS